MGDTPQNAGEGNEPASPFEQTQRILNNIIEQIRGLEWSECLAKLDKKNEADKIKIIGNDIKTEHAEEREAADREQIEAIEDVKAAERLQRNCEYVRGLCKLTIEHKRDNREAIKAAKKVLELLPKIERGDYRLWRELDHATYILLSELEANRGPSAKGRHPQPKTRKVPAETKQKYEGSKIMITAGTSKENWEAIRSEYDISKKDFGKKINFVSDPFKRNVIFRDVEHAFVLASRGFPKPAVILAGGVIEELLRLYLKHKKISLTSKNFVDYIKACEQRQLLKSGISKLSDSVREFRNLVHISKEETKRHTISKATAKGAVSSIFTIANDFQ